MTSGCPLLGVKRKSDFEAVKSAFDPHATLATLKHISSHCPMVVAADQMQGVLARIDANGVCDCSGCLMGHSDVLLVLLSPRSLSERFRAGARPVQCSEASCHSSGWKSRQQRRPDTVVVISSDGEGDRSVESLEVKAPVGWETGQIRTGGPAT